MSKFTGKAKKVINKVNAMGHGAVNAAVNTAIKDNDADRAMGLIATQAQIDKIAAEVRSHGIPDSLNRWIGMTPAALRQNQAQRTRIGNALRKGATMSNLGPKESALREARSSNLTEKDKAAIAEIKAAQTAKVEAKAKAKKAEKKENKKIRERQKAAAANGSKPATKSAAAPAEGRKGAFDAKTCAALVPMVKKGTTVGDLIKTARWGSCANPVRRVHRFVSTVINGDLRLKATIEGDGEEAKVKAAA